jgi:murein DD-endopeptidase MepM/ murein hydrolase activator NlpD
MLTNSAGLEHILQRNAHIFHPVVAFNPAMERVIKMDFTANNSILTAEIVSDTKRFSDYVNDTLKQQNATYGIGGYLEHRTVYSRSEVFDSKGNEEPRRLHLGIDIWGEAGTPVYAPLGGMVHSFAFNDRFGDYGATIILQHQIETFQFHTLYGHLSLRDIENLKEGKFISRGECIAHFGQPDENGHWPPHLHFQIIIDMELKEGDYPGVAKFSEKEKYAANCPDPDLILKMIRYTIS